MSTSPFQADGTPISLYVHIPFCETKCPYCDFNTYARIESLIPTYVEALGSEIELWGRTLGRPPVATVFFGGGTPSYLPAEDIASLMRHIGGAFDLQADAEVTLEANPGDFASDKLSAYLGCGVNRLSIGVQSFDDRLLETLGRRHSVDDAVRSFRMALDAGFKNVSIDLMYGLPHQSLQDWERTLTETVALAPPHISMYCLTLEEGTPMALWAAAGRIPEPDEDLAADMYTAAERRLNEVGYRHYEISNWALAGRESVHNLAYWKNGAYLGVGPGAHSYLAGCRFANLRSPKEYIRRMGDRLDGPLPTRLDAEALAAIPVVDSVETIDRRLEMGETMMMGLRLDAGITDGEFAERFGESARAAFGDTVRDMVEAGLLETADGCVKLTPRGRLLGNEVFSRFVA